LLEEMGSTRARAPFVFRVDGFYVKIAPEMEIDFRAAARSAKTATGGKAF